MNKAVLIGNLTKDPDLRQTTSGTAVCTFTVAVKRPHKKDETDFLPVVAWSKTAEVCGKYLSKGSKVAVSGSIQTRTYDGKDGTKRYMTEIVADEVEFLNTKKQENEYGEVIDDSELPF